MPLFKRRRRPLDPRRELRLYQALTARLEPELAGSFELLHSYYEGRLVHLRGRIVGEDDETRSRSTARIIEHCAKLGLHAHVSGDPDYAHIKLSVKRTPRPRRRWLYPVFGLLTLLTVLWAGGMHVGIDLLADPGSWLRGLPFALTLLAILGCHELGHYFTARRYGVAVTPPLFLPFPNPLIGTLGAVIQMRSPVPSRKALFDIGIAGPFSGVVVAIPVILIGLSLSTTIPGPAPEPFLSFSSPALIRIIGEDLWINLPPLYHLLRLLAIGAPGAGEILVLHPVAFAGWLGLFVTALNLVPVGQLDGGHVVYSGLRRLYKPFSYVMVPLILLLAVFWPGWAVWGIVLFFVSRKRPAPLDDITPLPRGRRLAAWGALLLFLLCLTPVPALIW